MSKKHRMALIIIVCIFAGLILTHLTFNYFIPLFEKMHSGMY
jgi:capsular polysaccharide biosynthesis protein